MKNETLNLLEELIISQQQVVLRVANMVRPGLTTDDILQPNDYPELENHPTFRYEEGQLAGLMSAKFALLALFSEKA